MANALEQMMPPVQYADVNGIRMAYWEAGPRGEGVPVILCHGFPELAFSWRHQLKALGEAGRWAVAPDQRGYGLTSAPAEVAAYDMEHLCADLIGLLDHLGAEKAIWCGHDWGGIIVWQMALMHPDRTAGVIGVNTPFMPRPPADPIEIMRRRMGDDMYIVAFQRPGEADALLGADAARTMDMFLRRPVPGVANTSKGLGEEAKDGESAFALHKAVAVYDPAHDPRPRFLTDEEFAVFAETFTRTGFTGGINWYRNFTRNWERAANLPTRIEHIPCLMVTAELDAVLPPSAAEGMDAWIDDLRTTMISGSGHWTQQEQPEALSTVICGWLNERFLKPPRESTG
jgi:pimeloyl-ACP methyl ester carboxylesterase